jgi:uncharacterized membrane protein HdeD (DUF308 family)
MPRERMDADKKHWMMHKRMKGAMMLVVGILVLVNVYWQFLDWATFIGVLFVLGGLIKLIMPSCKKCGK